MLLDRLVSLEGLVPLELRERQDSLDSQELSVILVIRARLDLLVKEVTVLLLIDGYRHVSCNSGAVIF